MATLAGVFAASHSPLMVTAYDRAPAAQAAAVRAGFAALAAEVRACAPDAVISISDDHFRAVTLASMPAFQIGIAPQSSGLGDWSLPALVVRAGLRSGVLRADAARPRPHARAAPTANQAKFLAAYHRVKTSRPPTPVAFAYDAAMLIGMGLRAAKEPSGDAHMAIVRNGIFFNI